MKPLTTVAVALSLWVLAIGGCGSSSKGVPLPTGDPGVPTGAVEGGTAINLDTATVTPPSGLSIASVDYSWGDGTTTSGTTTSHIYTSGGNYTLTVTYTYDDGQQASVTYSIAVSPPGAPVITITSLTLKVTTDESATVTVNGQTATSTGNAGDPYEKEKKFVLGTDIQPADPGAGVSQDYNFQIDATDGSANQSTKTVTITLQ